jgi:hypothetical protein
MDPAFQSKFPQKQRTLKKNFTTKKKPKKEEKTKFYTGTYSTYST